MIKPITEQIKEALKEPENVQIEPKKSPTQTIAPAIDVFKALQEFQAKKVNAAIKKRRVNQWKVVAVARAKYNALKAKIRTEKERLREQGRDDSQVQVPKDLTDSSEYVKKVRDTLNEKFKVVKQELRQLNNRNGEC